MNLEALRIARETGLIVPFILITATVSEEYAVHVIREGASRVGFYNGTVRILSGPGQGCIFTVTIPLLPSPW
jgi:hypothetical protein